MDATDGIASTTVAPFLTDSTGDPEEAVKPEPADNSLETRENILRNSLKWEMLCPGQFKQSGKKILCTIRTCHFRRRIVFAYPQDKMHASPSAANRLNKFKINTIKISTIMKFDKFPSYFPDKGHFWDWNDQKLAHSSFSPSHSNCHQHPIHTFAMGCPVHCGGNKHRNIGIPTGTVAANTNRASLMERNNFNQFTNFKNIWNIG